MLDMALNLEQRAAELPFKLLVGVGLASVIVGLFIWLGGLGFRKLLAIIAGAVAGGVAGYIVLGTNTMAVAVSAAIGAVIAVMLEKVFMALLAAAMMAASAFFIIAELKEIDLSNGLWQGLRAMPLEGLAVMVAAVAVAIILTIYLWNFMSALCCAVLGTLLVFAGMVLLLLYKGTQPITAISNKPLFYGGVFVVMVAFGAVEQLLLCKGSRKEAGKKKTVAGKEESEPKHRKWRTS